MHWSVDLASFDVSNVTFESIPAFAIVDTGTSYMRVPAADFKVLKEALENR